MTIQQSHMDMIALQAIVRLSGADYQDLKGMPTNLVWRMYGGVIKQRHDLATLWIANLIIPRTQLLGYEISPAMEALSEQLELMSINALKHKLDRTGLRIQGTTHWYQIRHLQTVAENFRNPLYYPVAGAQVNGEILDQLAHYQLFLQEFDHAYRTGEPGSMMLNRALDQRRQRILLLSWFEHMQQVLELIEGLPSFKQMEEEILGRAHLKVLKPPSLRDLEFTIAISEERVHIIHDQAELQRLAESPLR